MGDRHIPWTVQWRATLEMWLETQLLWKRYTHSHPPFRPPRIIQDTPQVSSSSPLLSDDRPSDVQNPLPPIRELSSCLHQQGSQNRESVGDSDEVGSDFFLTVAPNFLLWPEGLRNLQLWASPCFQYLLSLSKVDIFEQGSNSFGIWGGGPGRGFFLVIFPLEMEKTKCI